jgi:hypothetical protein
VKLEHISNLESALDSIVNDETAMETYRFDIQAMSPALEYKVLAMHAPQYLLDVISGYSYYIQTVAGIAVNDLVKIEEYCYETNVLEAV